MTKTILLSGQRGRETTAALVLVVIHPASMETVTWRLVTVPEMVTHLYPPGVIQITPTAGVSLGNLHFLNIRHVWRTEIWFYTLCSVWMAEIWWHAFSGFFQLSQHCEIKNYSTKIVLHKCVMQIFAFCSVISGDMKLLQICFLAYKCKI